ncbi:MAG: DUF190 domain-containing protein [Elusimicrobiaceae bacterium]|nr:DUF190 domain-containing protein [Elusimicrobiaceae bacterium]
MFNEKKGKLLRIYIGEHTRHEGRPLYEWLVLQARGMHMSGATVLRGVEGFGASTRIHTAKIIDISGNLPVVVELVDTPEKIEKFLAHTENAIPGGLATLEDVDIRFYRAHPGEQACDVS